MRFLLLILCLSVAGCVHIRGKQVCFERGCVNVDVAANEEQMIKGLSGHAPLKEHEGMLFKFDREGIYSFWMKDMGFDLDILWIDKDSNVVYIKEEVEPCGNEHCPKFASPVPAMYILEVPAGYVKKNRIKVGDHSLVLDISKQ